MGADLNRHPPGRLAHGSEQRQSAHRIRHRFIGNRDGAGFHQGLGRHRFRRQVQIGKKDLALAKEGKFLRLRLLHLDDHFRLAEDLSGVRRDLRADVLVGNIFEPASHPGARLHNHLVPVVDKLANACRHEADAMLLDFNFLRNADPHGPSPLNQRHPIADPGRRRIQSSKKRPGSAAAVVSRKKVIQSV